MIERTLLLTPWYLPYRIVRWQDAITLLCLEKADLVASYDQTVRSPSCTMALPAVLRMHKPAPTLRRKVRFTRANVYARDGFTCQYCGRRCASKELSYDHVIPRAAGGATEWTNIVTACLPCNQRKGCMTCDEAGMWPKRNPCKPSALPNGFTSLNVDRAHLPQQWQDFLPASWQSLRT